MISSELPEVMGMSDRILVMRAGRIVAEVDRADATQAEDRGGDDERRAGHAEAADEASRVRGTLSRGEGAREASG